MGDADHEPAHAHLQARRNAITSSRLWLTVTFAAAFLAAGVGFTVVHASVLPLPSARNHQVHGSRFCGHRSYEILPDGLIARNDVYGPHIFQCLRVSGNRIKVVNSYQARGLTGYDVGSYPSVFAGCDVFGLCTKGYRPVRVSRLKAVYITVSTQFPGNRGRQQANDAADEYFTTGPLDGPRAIKTEFMMLLGWHRLAAAPEFVTLRYGGITWHVHWWRTSGGGYPHLIVQARAGNGRLRSLHHYNVMPLVNMLIRRGLVKRSWMATQWAWGNECWRACSGDATTRYAIRVVTSGHRHR